MLIQLTPVIRKHIELTGKKPREQPTPLGVICQDSMELHNPEQKLLEEGAKEKRKEYQHEIFHFPVAEEKIHENIKDKYAGKFSYVCANPPYIGEKGHKELFRQTLKLYPYWKNYYQGKMDYLYWFVILGLSKLREWGKLGYITSAYWPTADSALKLRKYILKNAKIKEMIFFEEVKIFEHAKGQNNMVFILTKRSGEDHKKERENNHIKIVQVKCKNQDLHGNTIKENLDFLTKHIKKYIDKPTYEDKFIKVFWSGVKQGELPQDGAQWNEILTDRFFKKISFKLERNSVLLCNVLDVKQGIVPGIDRITNENIKFLPSYIINERGIKIGDGVFVLNCKEARQITPNPDEYELLIPSYKNSHISPYYVDIPFSEEEYIIYIDRELNLDKYPNIKSHLNRFRELLEARLSRYEKRGYKETYPWYRLNRPRNRKILATKKIVVSNWGTAWQSFAYQTGEFFEKRDITIFVKKSDVEESLFYFLGILNSSLIKYWMKSKARQTGYMRQKLQEQIPIRRINFDNPKEVKMHDEIVNRVKSIRERMAELAKYSEYFSGPRLTKIPFDASLPEVNDEAIIKGIPSENVYNIRTHPELTVEKPKGFEEKKFYLSKVERPQPILTGKVHLKLKSKNKTSLSIEGPYELLKILFDFLLDWRNKPWSEIKENLLVPGKIQSFDTQKNRILSEVKNIRVEILKLQKQIDQIVYKLYDLKEPEIKIVDG